MSQDEYWMQRALDLARRGRGRVEPNPMVGAVVVRRERALGEGYHARYGGPHAEARALRRAGPAARGATLFVTLEPCSTHGKTPPCSEAILGAGIRRVVVGTRDPNPRNRNRGIGTLRRSGIEVHEGVLAREAREVLTPFRSFLRSRLPFVTVKWAMTLDGQVATRNGASRWISGDASRREAHRERAGSDAVLVGVGTVLRDDPLLTVRGVRGGRTPLRIVADGRLRTPTGSKLVRSACNRTPVWILAGERAARARAQALQRAGCRVLRLPAPAARARGGAGGGGRPDLRRALETLRAEGVHRILLEGGPTLAGEALRHGLVDRAIVFVGGRLFGGDDGRLPLRARGCANPGRSIPLRILRRRSLGPHDVLVEGLLEPRGR